MSRSPRLKAGKNPGSELLCFFSYLGFLMIGKVLKLSDSECHKYVRIPFIGKQWTGMLFHFTVVPVSGQFLSQ
jgi:hypothetical protein